MSKTIEKLRMAQVSSCSCLTKTPEASWHDEHCLYLVLSEAIDELAAPAVERQEPVAYVLARQTAVEVPGQERKELGYTLLDGIGVFHSREEVHAAIAELGLPLGWVSMTVEQLLPGWMTPADTSPPAPVAVVSEPISCDAANEENAPTFMGEPNIQHPIEWYQEGIAKHWKTICDQRLQVEKMAESLKFYADRDHYSIDDGLNWDSCSGEPMNILWHESEPWFIEDGSIARACLDKVKEMNK